MPTDQEMQETDERILKYRKGRRNEALYAAGASLRGEVIPMREDNSAERARLLETIAELDQIQADLQAEYEKTRRVSLGTLGNVIAAISRIESSSIEAGGQIDSAQIRAWESRWNTLQEEKERVRPRTEADLKPEQLAAARKYGQWIENGAVKSGATPEIMTQLMTDLRNMPVAEVGAYLDAIASATRVDVAAIVDAPDAANVAGHAGDVSELRGLIRAGDIYDAAAEQEDAAITREQAAVVRMIESQAPKGKSGVLIREALKSFLEAYPDVAAELGVQVGEGGAEGEKKDPTELPFLEDTRERLVDELDALSRASDAESVYQYNAITTSPAFANWVKERGYQDLDTRTAFRRLVQERRWAIRMERKEGRLKLEQQIANGSIENVPAWRRKVAEMYVSRYPEGDDAGSAAPAGSGVKDGTGASSVPSAADGVKGGTAPSVGEKATSEEKPPTPPTPPAATDAPATDGEKPAPASAEGGTPERMTRDFKLNAMVIPDETAGTAEGEKAAEAAARPRGPMDYAMPEGEEDESMPAPGEMEEEFDPQKQVETEEERAYRERQEKIKKIKQAVGRGLANNTQALAMAEQIRAKRPDEQQGRSAKDSGGEDAGASEAAMIAGIQNPEARRKAIRRYEQLRGIYVA